MLVEVKIPNVGESIVTARILSWRVSDGDQVKAEDELLELETEKVTISVTSEATGKIRILVPEDREVAIGTVVATIEAEGQAAAEASAPTEKAEEQQVPPPAAQEAAAEAGSGPSPAPAAASAEKPAEEREPSRAALPVLPFPPAEDRPEPAASQAVSRPEALRAPVREPEAPRTQGRETAAVPLKTGQRKVRMSLLRQSLSRRLVAVKNETAMLTTFNEVDMSSIQDTRRQYGEEFLKENGVKLGLMSFFIRAAAVALREYPEANAYIDGYDVIYHDYADIGFAVSTDRGLMVPILRRADGMSFADLEKQIAALAEKARKKAITLEELEGGTFTITNGGVFGSLLSTPILNPPQSAILGMHSIQDRPVAREGQVVIRPMMYVALSYDHRLLDGKQSVGFLKRIKELLEDAAALYRG